MKQEIANNNLEDKVNLSAAFCLGKCKEGVSVRINDDIICGVSKDNFNEFFQENILSKFN